jgi:hypothetical protein
MTPRDAPSCATLSKSRGPPARPTPAPPVTIETTPYEISHGRSPRGRGCWAFCPFHLRNATNRHEHTAISPLMTFTAAKRWARQQPALAAVGVVAVLP